jgi:hypothetical protein
VVNFLLFLNSEIRNLKSAIESLIPKPILVPAIRALPGDGIAGHSPYVFIHTFLTDMEAAAAPPAEAKFLTAAVAGKAGLVTASAPGARFYGSVFHCCCFRVLLI